MSDITPSTALKLLEALLDSGACLTASISLLERSPKIAAPSDRMFDEMLNDYRAALARTRAAIARAEKELEKDR